MQFNKERRDYLEGQQSLIQDLILKLQPLLDEQKTTAKLKEHIGEFEKMIYNITHRDFQMTTIRQWDTQFDYVISLLENAIKLFQQKQKSSNKNISKTQFTKQTNIILKEWLFAHYSYPYPQIEDIEKLALKCNLTKKQIQIWFINARGRIANKAYSQNQFKNIVKEKYFETRLAEDDQVQKKRRTA